MMRTSRRPAIVPAAATLLFLIAGCTDSQPVVSATPPAVKPIAQQPPPPPLVHPLTADMTSIGQNATYVVQPNDTLLDVARKYDLGYTQLMTANHGLDPWAPQAGKPVKLPAHYLLPEVPRTGIVINLPQHRLFYFPPGGKSVQTFPIGTAVQGWPTPLGVTKVARKELNPVWHVPRSIRAENPDLPAQIGPGPDNPLGDRAMPLGWSGYLIHSTNKPYGIGRNVSHGCIHLYPEDMEWLYTEVSVGTPVRVINQEVVSAWLDGALYIAVFPNTKQAEFIDLNQPMPFATPPHLHEIVEKAARRHPGKIDWQAVDTAARERSGMPVRVTAPSGGAAEQTALF